MDRPKCKFILLPLILILPVILNIQAVLAENIDPDTTGCKYAWGENTGWINFKPSQGPGVTVTETAVTGFAWGENIGWINLNPTQGGVINDGQGNLSGYAWGENVGWINFKPANGGVSIGSDGKFTGQAWGENIGWINFSAANTCVKTAWVIDTTDPSAPGTPADAGVYSAVTTVTFTWTAATDAESGIAGYNVQVGTTPGGNDVLDASVGNVLTKDITGSQGQTLYARVQAVNGAGLAGNWSGNSNGITINLPPSVLVSAPSATVTSMGPVAFTVSYNDSDFAASTLSVGNVALNKTGTANGVVIVAGSGNTRTVSIIGITGSGALGISIAAGTAVDLAGNLALAAGPSSVVTVNQPGSLITAQSLSSAGSYTAGAWPNSVATADFDSDGNADLVVANYNGNNISTLFGDGTGVFSAPTNTAVQNGPVTVITGDYNNDGKSDVVVLNRSSNSISLLSGNGDGTFAAPVNTAAGAWPNGVTTADFNGDGNLDVAVGNYTVHQVSVLLGNGNGTFQSVVSYPTGSNPYSVAHGDFNGDGNLDLAVAALGSNQVSILSGNGDGTFAAAVHYAAGAGPINVGTGDFNGDGKLDLAIASNGSDSVAVLLGNGDGTFNAPVGHAAGSQPADVVVGDFNGDGKDDLVVVNSNSNSVSMLIGNGDATFQAKVDYSVGLTPFAALSGDFNNDGRPDLAVANNASGNVTILLNNMLHISTSAGPNGVLVCAPTMVSPGGNSTCVATPYPGYHIDTMTGCGGSLAGDTLTISGLASNCTVTATFAADPVNGACSASNGQTLISAPTTSLCDSGIASVVSGSGPWTWTCNGVNGGTTANCSALNDTAPPALSVSTLADGSYTNNQSLNVSGTVTDDLGLQSLLISGATVTVNPDNTFSHLVTLNTGSNTITTVATDLAGNQATDTRVIILDQNGPALAILLPADNSFTNQLVSTVTGTMDETSTVSVRLNNGTPQLASMTGNTFSASVNLVSGMNTIDITATDLAGNTSSGKRTVTYDPTAPSVAITIPAQDITTSQATITITGTVTDTLTQTSATISVDGIVSGLTVTSGSITRDVPFTSEGLHTIIVTATDEAGNSSSVQRNISYVKFGDLDDDGDVDTVDALKALRIAAGLETPTATEMVRGNVAPIVDGKPNPDGKIDIGDVVVILRRSVGLVSW